MACMSVVLVWCLQAGFACAHPSSVAVRGVNSDVTEELGKLLQLYRARNDTWRVAGYQKAIAAINAHPTRITSYAVS